MRRAAAVLVASIAGCSGGGEETAPRPPSPSTPRVPSDRPLTLERVPRWAARLCRVSRLLRPLCPERVPAGRYAPASGRLAPVGAAERRFDFFALTGRRAREPRAVRLVFLASRYGLGSSVGGVFATWRGKRAKPVRWGSVRGELLHDRSDPSVPEGRLVVRWQARGVDYAVSIHAWEPTARAVTTLRAVVASTPAAGPVRRRRA